MALVKFVIGGEGRADREWKWGDIMGVGQLALMTAALFAGAAIYVSVAEQPARSALDDRGMLTQWKPSYKHGAAMQAPLALVGCLLGLVAWWHTKDWRWLAGAIVLVANWPYTLLIIRPVNNELLAIEPSNAGPQSRALIEKWGRLHAGRTALGGLATVLFLWASIVAPN